MGKYFTIVSLIGLIVFFQNCSDQQFSAKTDQSKPLSIDDSELVEQETPDVIIEDEEEVVENDDDDHEHKPPVVVKENDDDDDDDYKPPVVTKDDDDDDSKPPVKEEPRKRVSCHNKEDGNARYVCTLSGSGKSTHMAVVESSATSGHSTPKTACMSESACEDIVGQKMDVKSVENRGYCKNGTPQVLLLSDTDVQSLMDKIH